MDKAAGICHDWVISQNFLAVTYTFSVCHGIEETPGGIRSNSALDERNVMRSLNAHDSEKFHKESGIAVATGIISTIPEMISNCQNTLGSSR